MAQSPKPGDQIEIFRGAYQHWAIYIGNGYVIHLTSTDGRIGNSASIPLSAYTKKGIVKKEKLSEVAGNDKWKVNNEKDKRHEPWPVNEIITFANKCVGYELEYHPLKMNCEHFATFLRYGKLYSGQAEDVTLWGTFFATAGAVGFGIGYLISLILGKHH